MYTILLSEEDKQLRAFLKKLLQLNGYDVLVVLDINNVIKKVSSKQPQLVILDATFCNQNIERIVHEIKKIQPQIRVLVFNKHPHGNNADDYLDKPFTPDVFLARIKARLREENDHQSLVIYDKIKLDRDNFQAIRGKLVIELTPREYALLSYLITNPNRVLTREMILDRVWTYSPNAETRVVDIFISFLRDKIDRGFKRRYIHSVRGFGYKFS
jgi:DNA-binding response OmpR family regulator